jgi:hypothetical protein
MPVTVVTTPAAADANSYCSVAEGDTYHLGHLYATKWTDASADRKATAVVMATRLLDSLYEWAEFQTTVEQALAWPRTGILARNQLAFVGEYEIPIDLINATAEFARQLLEADRSADNVVETMGVTSLTAGPVSLTFKDGVLPKVIPDAVQSMLPSWWGIIRGATGIRELIRA